MAIARYDHKPNREKNTTISLPLTKPEPSTVPRIANRAEINEITLYFMISFIN
jgi:hypothetical protein